MRKLIIVFLVAAGLVTGLAKISFASDWDKAGKALTIIEGLRVVTGGKVDIIGTITGINQPQRQTAEYRGRREFANDRRHKGRSYASYSSRDYDRCELVWVPEYAWREKYIPEYVEYRHGRKVVVEGHYERYLAEEGGHWEKVYTVCRR